MTDSNPILRAIKTCAQWRTGRMVGQPRCATCPHSKLHPHQSAGVARVCTWLGVNTSPDAVCKHHPDEVPA